ncbi:uncharacterized protein LOC112569562 isoform X2 [Pomacea canaliculata]|uniref:uncharacterized protein LOC112569562 isoform X2 n=1 Tax=Pomacea canaliculata TaxID=400727 RepID=UPI000D72FAE6|nr:uncharacterized protein LOC112569562 isoform X2 [Pomacea canaliculata]
MGFSFILIVSVIFHSGLAQLQLVPSDLLLNDQRPTLPVQISCGVPKGIDTATQVNIRIARYLFSQPTVEKFLASIQLGLTGDQTHHTPAMSGMLQVFLPQASCHDAGLYHCVIVAYNNITAPVTTQFDQNLTVQAGYLSPDGGSTVDCDFVINSDSSWYDFTQPIKTITNGSLQMQIVPDNVFWAEGLAPVSAEVSCELTGGVPASLQSSVAIRRLPSPPTLGWDLSSAHIVRANDFPDDARITGRIVVTLLQADCTDAGSYRCVTEGMETDYNLTVTSFPGNVTATSDPRSESYLVDSTVILSCDGGVGSYEAGENKTWQWFWEYRDYLSNTWIEYKNDSDITDVWPPYSVSGTCYTRQVSRLTRVLTVEDSQRSYRCIVRRKSHAAEATLTVGIVHLPEGNAAHHATAEWIVLYFITTILLALYKP